MEEKNEITYVLHYNIGDIVILKGDPKARQFTIRGVYIRNEYPQYDVTDYEQQAYVLESEIAERVNATKSITNVKAIAPEIVVRFEDDNTH